MYTLEEVMEMPLVYALDNTGLDAFKRVLSLNDVRLPQGELTLHQVSPGSLQATEA